ncbi:hypothetical protein DPMN_056121 [Dreissena polymorpha]|uniref:Uncharacterized protein n=1 Tax=Dreissena polymorpha TaxID=45954 RepID=A0A9D4CR52_DREPO|nr:hypothetical protein DPMN_056121 [Dreissena polymorpha]
MISISSVRVALSRLEACRELFKDSTLAEVKGIFSDCTNIELLKKIYYRSLCT